MKKHKQIDIDFGFSHTENLREKLDYKCDKELETEIKEEILIKFNDTIDNSTYFADESFDDERITNIERNLKEQLENLFEN